LGIADKAGRDELGKGLRASDAFSWTSSPRQGRLPEAARRSHLRPPHRAATTAWFSPLPPGNARTRQYRSSVSPGESGSGEATAKATDQSGMPMTGQNAPWHPQIPSWIGIRFLPGAARATQSGPRSWASVMRRPTRLS